MNSAQVKYTKDIQSRFMFFLFALTKFPSLLFWGIKVKKLEDDSCTVSVTYSYRTRNPFNSLYFAVSIAAAELSTGVLVQRAITGEGRWSMVVSAHESKFTKKGLGKLRYICKDGKKVLDKVQLLKKEKVGKIVLTSKGYDETGDEIGEFQYTWRLKYYD